MNTLNIHKGWLVRLGSLADNMYVTVSKIEARQLASQAQSDGFKLVLSMGDLGIYGYEHPNGRSALFYTQSNGRMVCTYGVDNAGLKHSIACELQSLWHIAKNSKPIDHPPYITTYKPIAGWKAIHMVWDAECGSYAPEQTGYFGYKDEESAIREAKDWAESEDIEYRPRA